MDATSGEPGYWRRALMRVLWSAFLVAGIAEAIFFTVFDPFELHFFGAPLDWSREAIYTMGFFGFWGFGIASAALALFLEHGSPAAASPPSGAGAKAGGQDGTTRGRGGDA